MSRGHYVISFFSVSVCVILASEGYVTVWSIRFHTHTHTYTLAKVGVCVCVCRCPVFMATVTSSCGAVTALDTFP